MFKNYFKIAWRNLNRNKAFTFTNVFGLSISIACSILIFTLITYHLSFDKFQPNAERIYRVVSEFHYDGNIQYEPGVPQPLGKAFRNDFSFAEKTARVRSYHDVTISTQGEKEIKKFRELNFIAFAGPEFFDIFNFPLVDGDKKKILTEPNTALVTQKVAKKYFNTEDAIGKIIRINSLNQSVDFKITGILKDIPANTDRREQIYLSYSSLKDFNSWYASDSSWGQTSRGMNFFVLLKPGISKATVENAFPPFVKKYLSGEDARVTQFKLQPLSDIHFNADFGGYIDMKYLGALGLIGFFLIITACVNFINLATAQALKRSKEVGIRKVLGGLSSQVFLQFIAETFLITLSALLLSYVFAKIALPYLNNIFKEELIITLLQNRLLPIFLIMLIIMVVSLSGIYPGLVLARFRPVPALKGKLSQKNIGGFSIRRILVVIQFAISQMLIIGVIVIAGQLHYTEISNLGFNKNAIVMLPIPINDKIKMRTLHTRLSEVAGVEKITFCFEAPASDANSFTSLRYDNRIKDEPWEIDLKDADDQYISTFDLKLVAGRNMFQTDTINEFLVNETVVRKLGLTSAQDVIGKQLSVNGGTITAPVVGVVKDFYNNSFRESISPIVIMPNYNRFRNCAIKINLGNTKAEVDAFKKIWNGTFPDNAFAFSFLDERIDNFYRQDRVMLKLVEGFAFIAIVIACLGLYGLVSFMAVQKTKEIGVRKVLGARLQNILWIFGNEFARLLVIAFCIAAPIAWWVMNKYLQDFTHRINIGIGIFALAIASTFMVAGLTVGYRSIKAAVANPVKSLRTE